MSSNNNSNRNNSKEYHINQNSTGFTNIFRGSPSTASKPKPISASTNFRMQNRHTVAIATQESFENVFQVSKLEENNNNDNNLENFNNSSNYFKKLVHQDSNDSAGNGNAASTNSISINNNSANNNNNINNFNSSPLSKTPDSNTDIGNWIDASDSGIGNSGACSNIGIGSGVGESDYELIESTNQSINQEEDTDSADEDVSSRLNSNTSNNNNNNSGGNGGNSYLENYGEIINNVEDHTTKRLKTFVATTLHNEHVYLDKLSKLLNFKSYLEDNFNGSLSDINLLFSDLLQIYKIHEVVAIKLQDYLNSFSDFAAASSAYKQNKQNILQLNQQTSISLSNALIKEAFLSSALQLLANIMEISFPVYLEFVENYPRSLSILNKLEKQSITSGLLSKRKSFLDCQTDFNNKLLKENLNKSSLAKDKRGFFVSPFKFSKGSTLQSTTQTNVKDELNIYYNDSKRQEERIETAKIFSEEILHRPTKLFLFIHSLKDECMLAANELPISSSNGLKANIKSMFDNEQSKNLREKVFEQIKLNIMPKEARKHEDVVELSESNNERKLRHLILYGDSLVCCRLKKDKRQLKWFIPIDKLEIFLDDYKSAKSESELRHLREEVVSLRGDLKKEENVSTRNQQRIKKKLAEHQNELTLQSSRLKLIVRYNPSLSLQSSTSPFFQSNTSLLNSSGTVQTSKTNLFGNHGSSALSAIGTSMTNLSIISGQSSRSNISTAISYSNNNNLAGGLNSGAYNNNITSSNVNISNNNSTQSSVSFSSSNFDQFVFLFTSDFERIAWLEEINSAIFSYKTRKMPVSLQQSDIESRINTLKKIEEPPKAVTSSCTGSLELLIRHIEDLIQPNKVFVAVELKSCGSYLQVAQTKCTELTKSPIWNEKFTLEMQCVDSLRIILYCQTSGKALAISSQELKIDSNVNLDKLNIAKLNNGISIHIAMKFLSPKKTITRRRTRNKTDIFGGNLAELLQREKTSIPKILKDCVEVIETKGIDEVGIYRVSSVVSEVQKMKDLYSKNPINALNELRQKSPHLAANVLKLYLRELPDPLFTTHLYHRFMAALDCSVPEFRSVELCRIFNDLPELNKTIILFILTHLLNIASHSEKNMMGLQNLCTLFGPTLMKLSPKDNLQADDMAKEIKESMQQAQVLFYILKLHSEDRLIVDPEQKEQLNQIAQSQQTSLQNESRNNVSNVNFRTISPKLDNNNNSINKSSQDHHVFNKNILAKEEKATSKSHMQTAL